MKGREKMRSTSGRMTPDQTTPLLPPRSHQNDMDVIIKGWEIKFEQISRCLRDVQLASEKANSDMFNISREGRAREDQQERRLEAMHVGLTEFLEKCDPAHLITSRPPRLANGEHAVHAVNAHRDTVPTTSGFRVPTISCGPGRATRDHDDIRDTRTREHDDIRSTRTRDHDDIRDTRTRDHDDIRDTRIREHKDARDTRT